MKTRDIRSVLSDHDHVVECVAFASAAAVAAINRLMGAEVWPLRPPLGIPRELLATMGAAGSRFPDNR